MLRVKPGAKKTSADIEAVLVAPCGVDCALCMRFLRAKDACQGCRADDEGKAASCVGCAIRTCEHLASTASGYCFECTRFPCARLKRLDARYREKYRSSLLENLETIRDRGIDALVAAERATRVCPECGGLECMHTPACIYCGHVWG
jgi:hypothetical protein